MHRPQLIAVQRSSFLQELTTWARLVSHESLATTFLSSVREWTRQSSSTLPKLPMKASELQLPYLSLARMHICKTLLSRMPSITILQPAQAVRYVFRTKVQEQSVKTLRCCLIKTHITAMPTNSSTGRHQRSMEPLTSSVAMAMCSSISVFSFAKAARKTKRTVKQQSPLHIQMQAIPLVMYSMDVLSRTRHRNSTLDVHGAACLAWHSLTPHSTSHRKLPLHDSRQAA